MANSHIKISQSDHEMTLRTKKAPLKRKAPTRMTMHQAALTLPLEGDGEGVLAVGVAHRAVVLPEVGGDDVADHQRAAHPVRPPALLHPVVPARRARHL